MQPLIYSSILSHSKIKFWLLLLQKMLFVTFKCSYSWWRIEEGLWLRLAIKSGHYKEEMWASLCSLWISQFRLKSLKLDLEENRLIQAELTLAVVVWRASWASVKHLGQRGAKAAKQKLLEWSRNNGSCMKTFEGMSICLQSHFTQRTCQKITSC